eukprot:GHUV01032476.1.p2 GENE.GHUV01032476.1~~GHUV01032476.1.p2  ORF type:complete len:149 (-),score=50.90 GHUV01032476.1:189-635(-)
MPHAVFHPTTCARFLLTDCILVSAVSHSCMLVLLQVELLLTLEEFCGEEGVFEQPEAADATSSAAAGGAVFAPLFANLLQLLYDGEVVEEAAITNWAAEKEHADESEKVFLQKVGCWGDLTSVFQRMLVQYLPASLGFPGCMFRLAGE